MSTIKHNFKNKKKIALLCIIVIVTIVGLIIGYLFGYRSYVEPNIPGVHTNTDSLYPFLWEKQRLSQYDILAKSFQTFQKERDNGTYIIPGLKSTTTLEHEHGRFSICTSMTPQSVCVVGKYILVGAYCRTGTHNSVIYVLDKSTHNLIKTVVLKDRTHIGGIAYDSKHENIWVTGKGSIAAQANSFELKDLEGYRFDLGHKPLLYTQSYPLFSIVRDSFMTYHDGYLYAGYFTVEGESVLQKFRINRFGGLVTVSSDHYKEALKVSYIPAEIALPVGIAAIPERIQGVTFYKDKMLLSQSFGIVKSKLFVYDNKEDGYFTSNQYDKTKEKKSMKPEKTYELPQKMEQIYTDEDGIYAIFESAAYCYRGYSFPRIDRIIKLDAEYITQ